VSRRKRHTLARDWPAGPEGRCTNVLGCRNRALPGRWVCQRHALALALRSRKLRDRGASA
jgi:hypothetical protein